MRALGRSGGRKAPGEGKRREREREPLRGYLRRVVTPEVVWESIRAALESTKESDRLAGAKLILSELYDAPADRRELEIAAGLASARTKLAEMLDERARRMSAEQRIDRARQLLRDAASDPRTAKELAERCLAAVETLDG